VVADLHVGHALADLGDDPGSLVAEDGRGGLRDDALQARQVRVAHPGRLDLHLDLARAHVDELDVVPHLEGVVADVPEQSCAHGFPLENRGVAGGAYRLLPDENTF
jgi:hypothetical protein